MDPQIILWEIQVLFLLPNCLVQLCIFLLPNFTPLIYATGSATLSELEESLLFSQEIPQPFCSPFFLFVLTVGGIPQTPLH